MENNFKPLPENKTNVAEKFNLKEAIKKNWKKIVVSLTGAAFVIGIGKIITRTPEEFKAQLATEDAKIASNEKYNRIFFQNTEITYEKFGKSAGLTKIEWNSLVQKTLQFAEKNPNASASDFFMSELLDRKAFNNRVVNSIYKSLSVDRYKNVGDDEEYPE